MCFSLCVFSSNVWSCGESCGGAVETKSGLQYAGPHQRQLVPIITSLMILGFEDNEDGHKDLVTLWGVTLVKLFASSCVAITVRILKLSPLPSVALVSWVG